MNASWETYPCKSLNEQYNEEISLLYSYYKDVVKILIVGGLTLEDAEDVAQDTYIDALTNIESLRDKNKAKSWLLTIAKRKASKYALKNKIRAQREEYIEDLDADQNLSLSESNEDTLSKVIGASEVNELYDALTKLSETERRILLLHYVCLYKFNEIAEILEMKDATVRSTAARSRQKLRRIIEEARSRYG